jgi:negative regulator of sigma E activity
VFVEQVDAGNSSNASRSSGVSGFTAKGAVNAFGNRVGNHQVTVVGAVPVMTIRLIGGSVVPVRETSGSN